MSWASELRLPLLLWVAVAALSGCDAHRHPVAGATPANSYAGRFRLAQAYEVPSGFEVRSLALLPGDLLLAEGVGEVWVYGLSADRGGPLWQRDLGHKLLGRPAAVAGDDTYLYTLGSTSQGRYVWCLDPYSGRVVRELPVRGSGRAQWYFEDGWLFVTDSGCVSPVTAVDLAGWRVAWEWRADLAPLGGGVVDVAAGRRLVAVRVLSEAQPHDRIYLLDRASGCMASMMALSEDYPLSDLIVMGSLLYVSASEGNAVRALDLDSGRVLWHYHVEETQRIVSLHGLGNATSGSLLVQTTGSKDNSRALVLLDGRTGQVLRSVGEEGLGSKEASISAWREFSPGVIVGVGHSGDSHTVLALSASTGRLLWRHSGVSLCPELGSDADCSFVAGDYRDVVLLRLLRFPEPTRLALAAVDPVTGKTRAKMVDPAGVRYAEMGDVVSDGRMLYLHDMGRRRLLAYALPATH